MLRVIGLTLVVVTGAAKVGHAESRFDHASAHGVENSLQHTPTSAHDPSVQLQIGGGLAFAPTGRDDRSSGHFDLARTERQQRGREAKRLTRGRNAHGRSDGWLNLTASSKPSLAYSVTDSLSLGLNYNYKSGETMNFDVAKAGGLDSNYQSHNFMVRAHLEF